jgi:hypothetical protein
MRYYAYNYLDDDLSECGGVFFENRHVALSRAVRDQGSRSDKWIETSNVLLFNHLKRTHARFADASIKLKRKSEMPGEIRSENMIDY